MPMSPAVNERLTALLPPWGRVLDVGCGDGVFLRSLPGARYERVGVDLTVETPRSEEGVTFLPGRGEDLPVGTGSFDAVVLQCVFSLCEPEAAASEILRVLKPGGVLLLSDLFSDLGEGAATPGGLVGRVWRRETMESFFADRLEKADFYDETAALTGMLRQAIMDGTTEELASCGDLAMLRRLRTRYGIWVWKKSSGS